MTTSRPSPHLFSLPMALAVVAACVSTLVAAQQPAAPQTAPPQPDPAALARQAELNKRPDTPGTGRFAAMKEEVASLPRHVVYRPKDLGGPRYTKLGVVAWGNGGCSEDGASSRFHLLEIASHGYLVIASGRILSGPGAPPREPRPAAPAAAQGQLPPPRTQVSDLTDAVDWALAENTARRQPVFRPHRSRADRVFGLELRRRAGAPGREGSAREDAGDPQQRRTEHRANHHDRHRASARKCCRHCTRR